MTTLTIVGPQEIADLLGVTRGTVKQWRYRGVMPEPAAVISGVPVWWRSSILKWAQETGRA